MRFGMASRVLPALCKNEELEVVQVILAQSLHANRKKNSTRTLKKLARIGLLGALNGIRIRPWYRDNETEDIINLCKSLSIPCTEVPFINCETSKALFRNAQADLGLSLGNGYIPQSIFSIPKHGMINIHTELLPQFQGAQSIIWPIFEKTTSTGFTIHQIDKSIDTGDILFQKLLPIQFYPSLRKTVEKNLQGILQEIPMAFAHVCAHYAALKAKAIPQIKGKTYTTPTFWQFLRMLKNHRILYKNAKAFARDDELASGK